MHICLLRAILSNAVLVAVLVGEVSLGEYARDEECEAIVDRPEDTGGGGHRDCSSGRRAWALMGFCKKPAW
jgi:hypothetical protein